MVALRITLPRSPLSMVVSVVSCHEHAFKNEGNSQTLLKELCLREDLVDSELNKGTDPKIKIDAPTDTWSYIGYKNTDIRQ